MKTDNYKWTTALLTSNTRNGCSNFHLTRKVVKLENIFLMTMMILCGLLYQIHRTAH